LFIITIIPGPPEVGTITGAGVTVFTATGVDVFTITGIGVITAPEVGVLTSDDVGVITGVTVDITSTYGVVEGKTLTLLSPPQSLKITILIIKNRRRGIIRLCRLFKFA